MNIVVLCGNIGKKPELKRTQNSAVLGFSLATTERYKSGDEWKDQTEWHNIEMWGKRAESIVNLLDKGMRVTVHGKIRTQSWEDRNTGQKKYRTSIIAADINFTPVKRERQEDEPPPFADTDFFG